jgi:hypothetical protein
MSADRPGPMPANASCPMAARCAPPPMDRETATQHLPSQTLRPRSKYQGKVTAELSARRANAFEVRRADRRTYLFALISSLYARARSSFAQGPLRSPCRILPNGRRSP